MTIGARSTAAGFTLIEILVAFTIVVTALGLMLQINANSTRSVALSQEYQGATAIARALLADASTTEHDMSFARSGKTDKFHWAVRGEALAQATASKGAEPYELRRISVEVTWLGRDRERRIAINTIKPFFKATP